MPADDSLQAPLYAGDVRTGGSSTVKAEGSVPESEPEFVMTSEGRVAYVEAGPSGSGGSRCLSSGSVAWASRAIEMISFRCWLRSHARVEWSLPTSGGTGILFVNPEHQVGLSIS